MYVKISGINEAHFNQFMSAVYAVRPAEARVESGKDESGVKLSFTPASFFGVTPLKTDPEPKTERQPRKKKPRKS